MTAVVEIEEVVDKVSKSTKADHEASELSSDPI